MCFGLSRPAVIDDDDDEADAGADDTPYCTEYVVRYLYGYRVETFG
jgi:hypothetical protein